MLTGLVAGAGYQAPAAYASDPNSLNMYIDQPLVQGSYRGNAITFDTANTGVGNCGSSSGISISSACRVDNVANHGGASNSLNDTATVGGSGSRFATTNGSTPFTITVPNDTKYLGLWWSAGSTGNTMKFYQGNTLLLTVTLQDMISLLGSGPSSSGDWTTKNTDDPGNVITALNGTTNRKMWYFGNPRGYASTSPSAISTISNNEPFVYLHMFVGGDLTFNKVELSGAGFEIDNLAVSTVAQAPNPRLVLVSQYLEIAGLSTVQFNGNGTGVEGETARQVASTARALTTNAFTRPGFTFTGWNTAADGTGTAYAEAASYPFTSSTTLYAQWTPISYTVSYDTQGGSAVAGGTYTIGSAVTLPAAPTRSGFTFAGWFAATTGGTALGNSYSPPSTGNITIFAQWTPIPSATVPIAAPASLSALANTGADEQVGFVAFGLSGLLIFLGAGLLWFRRRLSIHI